MDNQTRLKGVGGTVFEHEPSPMGLVLLDLLPAPPWAWILGTCIVLIGTWRMKRPIFVLPC